MKLTEIDFLVVGAAKSATTWLRHQLQADPQIYMPDPESHYFSREYHRGTGWYLSQFTPHAGATLIGEKSNSYMDTPVAARRMHDALPHVRLIAILRDPVERAYSDYCMFYRRGAVSADIEAYLDPRQAAEGRFLQISRYDLHLARLLDHYPADALHVARYEDVKHDPGRVLNEVRAHLGLAPAPLAPTAERRVNDSGSRLLPLGVRRALAPLKPIAAPLRGTRSFETVRGLIAKEVAYPILTAELRTRMEEYFQPMEKNLDELAPGIIRSRFASAPKDIASGESESPASTYACKPQPKDYASNEMP